MKPFFAREWHADLLLAEIAEWDGTRFWGGCGARAKKGVGADCVGWAAKVFENVGAIQPFEWPEYVVTGGGAESFETIVRTIGTIPEFRTAHEPLMVGDLVLRSVRDDYHHVGIFDGDRTLWHMTVKGLRRANIHDRQAVRNLRAIYRVYEP